MKPLKCPYIPDKKVSMLVVSGQAPQPVLDRLNGLSIEVIKSSKSGQLPPDLSFHPDMQFVNIAEGIVIASPEVNEAFQGQVKERGFTVLLSERAPVNYYPGDVLLNAAIIDNIALLNMKYSDKVLMLWLKKTGKKLVHVNQGYAKCSTAIVNRDALITSDRGIYKAASENHKDVLLIKPLKEIQLPGYDYGFIGGATGLISEKEMVFTGDFTLLDEAENIARFLEKYGIEPVSLSADPVVDLGSLVPLCSV